MKPKALLVILLAVPLIAMAGVNPKNGNFYITYQDVSLEKNGRELGITRTYNSKSAELGWFGYGWGSKFEARLVALPDGSAVIKENGAGLTTYYRTNNVHAVKAGIQTIVDAAKTRDNLTPAAAGELAAKLLGDEDLRVEKVVRYGIHVELPEGTSLDDFCGKASLTRVAEGYRRIDCDRFGDTESAIDTFDFQGRLIRHEIEDGYAVTISYADAGTADIRDTQGQHIALTWTPEGRVASAKTHKQSLTYTYDAKQDLVEVNEVTGNTYRHSYDNNHNLTRINYIDDSNMFISYSPRVSGTVDSVTERNGDRQTFIYRTDPNNSNHYWTKHDIILHTGKTSSKEYEFENEVSATGVSHLAKFARNENGNFKEAKFDSQNRMISSVDKDGEVSEYTYHPQSGKLIEVMNGDLKTEFKYDQQGNLIQAKNSHRQVITLDYNSAQKIVRILDVNRKYNIRRELTFEYNAAGQPIVIALVGTGSITVKYDDKGEISSTDSNQGPEMALQVSDVFKNLMKVVSVTGFRI